MQRLQGLAGSNPKTRRFGGLYLNPPHVVWDAGRSRSGIQRLQHLGLPVDEQPPFRWVLLTDDFASSHARQCIVPCTAKSAIM